MKDKLLLAALAVAAWCLYKASVANSKYDAPYGEFFDEVLKDPRLLLPGRDYHDPA